MNLVHYTYVPKVWLKMRIFTFGVAFHFFSLQVIVDTLNLVCGLNIAISPSLQTRNCPGNGRGHWTRHVTHFKFFSPKISLEQLKLQTSNLVYTLITASPSLRRQIVPERGVVTVT